MSLHPKCLFTHPPDTRRFLVDHSMHSSIYTYDWVFKQPKSQLNISSTKSYLHFQFLWNPFLVLSNQLMGFRFPSVIHAKKILRKYPYNRPQSAAMTAEVPKGYLAVYVGENEMKRFMIPVSYLNQSSFQDLLSQSWRRIWIWSSNGWSHNSLQRRYLHRSHFPVKKAMRIKGYWHWSLNTIF